VPGSQSDKLLPGERSLIRYYQGYAAIQYRAPELTSLSRPERTRINWELFRKGEFRWSSGLLIAWQNTRGEKRATRDTLGSLKKRISSSIFSGTLSMLRE